MLYYQRGTFNALTTFNCSIHCKKVKYSLDSSTSFTDDPTSFILVDTSKFKQLTVKLSKYQNS